MRCIKRRLISKVIANVHESLYFTHYYGFVSLMCGDKPLGKCNALFDTGAEFSIADESFMLRLGVTRNMLNKPCREEACAVNGHSLHNIGILKAKVRFWENEVEDDIMIVGAKLGQPSLLLNWKVSCRLRNDLDYPNPLETDSDVRHVVEDTLVFLQPSGKSEVHDDKCKVSLMLTTARVEKHYYCYY